MPTYYYVATFEANSPEEADEVANGRYLDPPAELPTIDEMAARIRVALLVLADRIENPRPEDETSGDPDAESGYNDVVAATARIMEIVTLGGVRGTPVDHFGTALRIGDVVRRHNDPSALGQLISFTNDGTDRAGVAWTHTSSFGTAPVADLVKSAWRPAS